LQPKSKFEMILKSKWDIDVKFDFETESYIWKDTMIFEMDLIFGNEYDILIPIMNRFEI
jgi:hypothetical protein